MKDITNPLYSEILRQKAEEVLKSRNVKFDSKKIEGETLKLIHELDVHQIELELQNEELVNAKKNAETDAEKYTNLYDFAPFGYLTLSQDGEILELNFHSAELLGKQRSVLIKSRFGFFVSNETRTLFNEFIDNLFKSKTKETCEIVLNVNPKSPTYIYLTGITSFEKGQCLITMVDISRRKEMEKELLKAKEHAEESDRLKLVFLANMSHEIRTPMNGILGFTELLKKHKLTGEERLEYIDIIEKSGKRMLNIINDIISISKVESGQVEISLTKTNVNEQIDYLYTFFKPEATQKGLQLKIVKQLPAKESIILTDKEKVYAILTNLIKNALKFTDSGSIEFGYEKKDCNIEFFVKDTGYGIPTSQQEIIFERFRQVNESQTRTHEGSGLGLAISKAYVEMLGGKIGVESKEGKGSTFHFTIPYGDKFETKDKNTVQKIDQIIKRKEDKIKNLKVLIVEDDTISKLLITIALRPYTKEALKVSTGFEAIETCRNNPELDLIMMDINMPEMSGYEATKKIREFNKDIVIIAQTANGMQSDRDNAIAAGCNDYISKPIDITTLNVLIQKYFSK